MVRLDFVLLWFFFGGIAHFAATQTEMRIVPAYIPWPRAAVLVSAGCSSSGRPDDSAAVLWLRLPIQVALLVLIAWWAAPDRRDDNPLSYYRVI